jgi:DNA-binding beta-propeller fold protein YncE
VAFSSDGHFVFVDSPPLASLAAGSELGVFASTSSSHLVAKETDHLPRTQLLGMSRSPDGRYLVVANESGAQVFSTARMERSSFSPSSWLVGSLESEGTGAIEATFSPDGSYLFVTLEGSREMAVFNFEKAISDSLGETDLIGYVPLGLDPVGTAISPNGRYLYATSEVNPSSSARQVPGVNASTEGEGTLTTIDLRRAIQDPSHAVISTVWAGCSPVRVVATSSTVYVTARGSDELIRFSASELVSDPRSALTGTTAVGELPVGLALVGHERTVIIADSNRFNIKGSTSNLAVVTDRGGENLVLVGYVKAGDFPRDMAVEPDGRTLVVTNYASGQIERVVLAGLPS